MILLRISININLSQFNIRKAFDLPLDLRFLVTELGTGISCKGQLANKIFQTGFMVVGGVSLSYWNY